MATKLDKVLAHLRRVLGPPEGASTDGQLLARFVATRDEASFAALVRRHGPMVLGVCQRLLRHAQDAEDCFQATFLVLARKASAVRGEAVGSWLYSVAYRTSLEARALNARRRWRERQVEVMPHPEVTPADVPDWRPWLDRELSRLPEKYRTPVILCDLEGRTRREVAHQLSLPEGTLSSRLATARKMLAKRLSRHELPLAGGVLALSFSGAASAGVPESLVASTTKAAVLVAAGKMAAAGFVSAAVVTLTEGVLQTMFIAKLKTATVVLFGVAALGLGTGGLVYQTRAGAADARQADGIIAKGSGAETAQPEKDRDKRAAEDARDRERALREELERARREAEAARAEARALRQKAEAEAKAAAEVVRALQERLVTTQRNEERARYADLGRHAEALKLHEETLRLRKTKLGPDHPDTLASMHNLANSYAELGRHAEALKLREETLRLQKAKLGPDHPDTLASMHNLANSYADPVRRAEGQSDKRAEPPRRVDNADQRKALADLEVMAARINEQFEQQRRKLQDQLSKLERDRDEQFVKLKRRAEMLQRQDASQPRPAGGGAPAGADKLDQILQRLERMEQRLDRLERRKE
jgi:RNA polymerase sigma factor (sigma-70 family)